ncbi:MAG: hypothetical protein APF76_02370 [Desulfitibacter sp. BRH_c19]|nr:MAG: hypothetical protein APF76_02370 [Desulfitibacter sp. BRH_c19]
MTDDTNAEVKSGTISIKDGKIQVSDPINSMEEAVIIPGKNVTIMVDDNTIEDSTTVNSKNIIILIPRKVEPVRELELTVSPDKMTATLLINYKPGENYYIEDVSDNKRVVVNCLSSKPIEEPYTIQEILDYMNSQKVVYGIDREMVEMAIEAVGKEYIIAKGKPFVPGKDGWVEDLVGVDDDAGIPDEGEGIIRDRSIRIVKEHQKIARLHLSEEGEPGINVHGVEVSPPKSKEARLIAGPGTKYENSGMILISAIEGRLGKKNNKYTVLPVYAVEGDAGAKEGYIKFNGDVLIRGNVMDGMKVQARGKIEIFGFAANSTLIAGGEVHVHNNLVGCVVQAGGNDLTFQKAKEDLDNMEDSLKKFIKAAKSLKISVQQKEQSTPDGAILKILLEQKFSGLQNMIAGVLRTLSDLEKLMDTEKIDKTGLLRTIEHVKVWNGRISGMGPLQVKNLSELDYSLAITFTDIKKFIGEISESNSQQAHVKCPYIQNCDIQTTGDVIVKGKGCYNTKIFAKGNVEITGSPGVFKGGSITAKGWVKAVEMGSSAEIPTFIQVDKERYIKASIVHPGTILKCGPRIEKVSDQQSSLYFEA